MSSRISMFLQIKINFPLIQFNISLMHITFPLNCANQYSMYASQFANNLPPLNINFKIAHNTFTHVNKFSNYKFYKYANQWKSNM